MRFLDLFRRKPVDPELSRTRSTIDYLNRNREMLPGTDRTFVRLMESRIEAGLRLHTSHERLLNDMAGEVQELLAL